MATVITNKAQQVKWWIAGVREAGDEVGEIDVRRRIERMWPDLLPEIHEQICAEAIRPTPKAGEA